MMGPVSKPKQIVIRSGLPDGAEYVKYLFISKLFRFLSLLQPIKSINKARKISDEINNKVKKKIFCQLCQ
jgi:hypothetical protein